MLHVRIAAFRGRDPGSEPSDHWLIYNDSDTRRSTRFERNLLRDGFKVLPWEE